MRPSDRARAAAAVLVCAKCVKKGKQQCDHFDVVCSHCVQLKRNTLDRRRRRLATKRKARPHSLLAYPRDGDGS